MDYIYDCSIGEFVQFSSCINIGVFYKDKEWKQDVYEKLIKHFTKLECIQWTRLSNHHTYICLKNGVKYDFIKADNTARGYRFDYVYIQDGIDLEDEYISGRIYSSIVHKQDIRRLV